MVVYSLCIYSSTIALSVVVYGCVSSREELFSVMFPSFFFMFVCIGAPISPNFLITQRLRLHTSADEYIQQYAIAN